MLKQRLIDIGPRDRSGPRSANRFDYQDDWALCLLLELHERGRDYVVVFDYLDDVLVLDSASDPQAAIFYQVKTKASGNWTRSALVKQGQGHPGQLPSIIGKLYSNYEHLPDETEGLELVSNAHFKLKLQEGGSSIGMTSVQFDSLDETERQGFAESLESELGAPTNYDGLRLLVYQTSDLSLQGHVDHALGKLTNFLDRVPETTTKGAAAFYRTLKGEISRRAKAERSIGTFEELCRYRAISRAHFEDMLNKILLVNEAPSVVDELRHRLNAETVPYHQVSRICSNARKFITDRFDPTNRMLDLAERIVSDHCSGDEHDRLYEAIETLLSTCKHALKADGVVPEDDYIRAMIGVILSEEQKLQDAATDAQEEKA